MCSFFNLFILFIVSHKFTISVSAFIINFSIYIKSLYDYLAVINYSNLLLHGHTALSP